MTPGKKVLVFGPPGAGKTTFARALVQTLPGPAVVLDGDEVREELGPPGEPPWGREAVVRQGRRMGWMADRLTGVGVHALAAFCAPTAAARAEFQAKARADLVVWLPEGDPLHPARDLAERLEEPPWPGEVGLALGRAERRRGVWLAAAGLMGPQASPRWDPLASTGLLVGRFQPFHAGHQALAEEVLRRHEQVLLGVRTHVPKGGEAWSWEATQRSIAEGLQAWPGRWRAVLMPDVQGVYWGRDVGYQVGRIGLPPEVEAISGTAIRARRTKG